MDVGVAALVDDDVVSFAALFVDNKAAILCNDVMALPSWVEALPFSGCWTDKSAQTANQDTTLL